MELRLMDPTMDPNNLSAIVNALQGQNDGGLPMPNPDQSGSFGRDIPNISVAGSKQPNQFGDNNQQGQYDNPPAPQQTPGALGNPLSGIPNNPFVPGYSQINNPNNAPMNWGAQ